MMPYVIWFASLDVEQELDDVAVVHHVLLALGALQALGLHRRVVKAALGQGVVGDDLGPDEAPLKVGVDLARGLGCLGALA